LDQPILAIGGAGCGFKFFEKIRLVLFMGIFDGRTESVFIKGIFFS